MTNRILLVAGLALLLAVILGGLAIASGGFSASTNADVSNSSGRLVPVSTMPLQHVEHYSVERPYSGLIVARRSAEISFQRPGKIIVILVDNGDSVKQGDVIARLDTRRLEARKSQLQAELSQAVAVLAELQKGPRKEQIDVARAEMENLKAQLHLEETRLRRQTRLLRSGTSSQEDFDRTRYGAQAAQARYTAAVRRLDELLAGVRSEKIDAQQAAVKRMEALLQEITVELSDSILHAPFSGVFHQRQLDEGAVVKAGQPVGTVVERDFLEAHIGLPPRLAQKLAPGDQAQIQVGDRKLDATVRSHAPRLDQTTRTLLVYLTVDGRHAKWAAPGQVARIKVEDRVREDGFWAPTTSLVRGPRGLWSCFIVSTSEGEPIIQQRDIEVLHTQADRVFIRGTISAGEHVVETGTHRIVAGQRVAPMGEKVAVRTEQRQNG